MNQEEIEGSSGDEKESALKQNLFATSCCKRLFLLLSQCSVMQYMQRAKILVQLIHCWKQDIDVSITIIQKNFAQQSEIQIKEEPCLQDCQQMEVNKSPEIDELDEYVQFDQLSSQYFNFDAIQTLSNINVDACSSAVSGLNDNVSVTSDKCMTSVSKVNGNNTGASSMNLGRTIVGTGRASSVKTSVGKSGTSTTSINKSVRISTSKTCVGKTNKSLNKGGESKTSRKTNREDRRDKLVCKTSCYSVGKTDNKTNKTYKIEHSNVTDVCSSDKDDKDSEDDSHQESDNTIGNAEVCKSNDINQATINQDCSTSDDINSKKSSKNSREGKIPCTKCGKKFRDKSFYDKHITKCLNKLQLDKPEKPYKCLLCTRSFVELKRLKNHMTKIHKISDPLTEYKEGYACTSCDKRYETKRGLQLHMENHDPVASKPFECNICGMRFKQQSRLESHNLIHTGELPYKCKMCDKAYQQHHDLKDHIKTAHLNDRQYICTVCGNDFVTATQLRYHMRIHTGEKPYKCDICNKCFRLNRQMVEHKNIHRDYAAAFVCKICGAQFKLPDRLRKHVLIHSDKPRHSCSFCGKDFTYAHNLRVHLRVHTGERPYVCGVCGMSFQHLGTLKNHEESHK